MTESSCDVEDGAVAGALQNVAEDADQVDGVGGDLRLGGDVVLEFADAGIGPGGGLEHLLLLQHLGGVLEALVLQQALDQFAARILGGVFRADGRARQQHLALDVDEQRGGVDELAGHVHVAGLELVHVGQELRRDLGDGDVVDVDVLLADQVEQQVERAVVYLVDDDREGREIGLVVAGLKFDERLGGGRRRSFRDGSWIIGSRCGSLHCKSDGRSGGGDRPRFGRGYRRHGSGNGFWHCFGDHCRGDWVFWGRFSGVFRRFDSFWDRFNALHRQWVGLHCSQSLDGRSGFRYRCCLGGR